MSSPESIYALLEIENSKKIASHIVDLILKDNNRIDELMDCFFDEKMRICQRASWPVGLIADKKPELLHPYIQRMLDNLDTPHHNAVLRNTFRTFQEIDFLEDLEGAVFDKSFDFFLDVNNAIAIRVFAMTVCGNIALKYPELADELIPVIEEHLPHGSSGLRARGGKLLKALHKAKNQK